MMGLYRRTVVVGTPEQDPFLPPEALLTAIQGHMDSDIAMAKRATRLGCLYVEWVANPSASQDFRGEIGRVVGEIDGSISGLLPRPLPGVPRYTDSVGGVIARVAEAWACAHRALHESSSAVERHRAWDHLAEMREGYRDLVQLVLDGLITLPKSWPGIGWPGIAVNCQARAAVSATVPSVASEG